MRFAQVYQSNRFGLSFELFPPRTPAAQEELWRHMDQLMEFRPDLVTCTYGAGGTTREKTLEVITEVARRYRCATASHLTCVGATVDELRRYLRESIAAGIHNIVALRGDPPKGETSFSAVEGGFRYAVELVELIRKEFPELGIAVAGYPETHREAASPAADLENLRRKVEAGGEAVITQLYYDNADYFAFCERCRRKAVFAPVVPGILPITNLAQVQRIASLCGARLPEALVSALEAQGDDLQGQFEVGVAFATRQVQELIDRGAPGVHFYVLNKSPATAAILANVRMPRD